MRLASIIIAFALLLPIKVMANCLRLYEGLHRQFYTLKLLDAVNSPEAKLNWLKLARDFEDFKLDPDIDADAKVINLVSSAAERIAKNSGVKTERIVDPRYPKIFYLKYLPTQDRGHPMGRFANSVKEKLGYDVIFNIGAVAKTPETIAAMSYEAKFIIVSIDTALQLKPDQATAHEVRHAWLFYKQDLGADHIYRGFLKSADQSESITSTKLNPALTGYSGFLDFQEVSTNTRDLAAASDLYAVAFKSSRIAKMSDELATKLVPAAANEPRRVHQFNVVNPLDQSISSNYSITLTDPKTNSELSLALSTPDELAAIAQAKVGSFNELQQTVDYRILELTTHLNNFRRLATEINKLAIKELKAGNQQPSNELKKLIKDLRAYDQKLAAH